MRESMLDPGSRAQEAADLQSLEIVAAIRRDEEGDALARELARSRGRVRRLWPLPARLVSLDLGFP